ncbi:MAG: hypothetical protein M3495_16780 [Pseudomonadota bacterium]|nr:hypothetical protein [Pseudomonadota bacterium]
MRLCNRLLLASAGPGNDEKFTGRNDDIARLDRWVRDAAVRVLAVCGWSRGPGRTDGGVAGGRSSLLDRQEASRRLPAHPLLEHMSGNSFAHG